MFLKIVLKFNYPVLNEQYCGNLKKNRLNTTFRYCYS
jgi:hypothetical protein